jgi:hypothetical protein
MDGIWNLEVEKSTIRNSGIFFRMGECADADGGNQSKMSQQKSLSFSSGSFFLLFYNSPYSPFQELGDFSD